jgi:hypothetical protein
MSGERTISRRAFLAFAAAAGAALLARSREPALVALGEARERLLIGRLTSLLAHQESARVIGMEYARQYPAEARPAYLLGAIVSGVPGGGATLLAAPDGERRALLDCAMREDFAAERVVKLRGWMLSATEARLCALAALA